MANEIERKFLIKGNFKRFANKQTRIVQGYLSSVRERSVRVRIKGEKGYITVKGIGNKSGISRYEWEKEITQEEAQELLNMCEPGIIDKTRYIIPEESGLVFEVDEFYGNNNGLIIAEIELPSENYQFVKPEWLGKEVTGEAEYYNAMLSKHPYQKWNR